MPPPAVLTLRFRHVHGLAARQLSPVAPLLVSVKGRRRRPLGDQQHQIERPEQMFKVLGELKGGAMKITARP